MNERIKELMEQSMPVIDWKARNGVELNNGERLEYMTEWFDKFAELIIKDCANYITEYYPHSRYEAFYMKKHFGVE